MTTTTQSKTTQHLSDMAGAQKHVLEAVESQLETAAVKDSPEAFAVLSETRTILKKHIHELEILSDRYDTETKAGLKKLFTNVLGNLAGAYNHLRGEGAAREDARQAREGAGRAAQAAGHDPVCRQDHCGASCGGGPGGRPDIRPRPAHAACPVAPSRPLLVATSSLPTLGP